ncbi:DNA internalization-related competence protein ComEC/Rec2 [Dysosmobacter sp.]|uniref:DNA internalization-related competence protein ComEC/Rec2 n=1 Tax=Dysosmobacter sp. TaxID=2591382 RepID=UPI002A94EFC9|nr:DNA internalization-related competence protein ComEC/Rec2 [Dysosmobacter sp.]MDY5612390.1 DNA internalization-related competence protein ComEC/Rec2 [Dysosmobacter sp.]
MRKLALFTGAFSLGIFLAQYLLPAAWLLPMGAAAFVLACGRLALRNDWGRRALLMGTGLALAFGWNCLYVRQVQAPLEALADTDRQVAMTLCDYAVRTDYGAKVTVKLAGLPGKAVYYGSEALLTASPGQTVTDTVHLKSAAHIRDEDVTAFTSKGVFLLAYQRGEVTLEAGTSASPRWWPARMGHAMREEIAALFEGDTAGFLTAILTGDKSGLSEWAAADLSEAGLYHILAVSGMHCGFLLTLVVLLAGRHRRKLVAGVVLGLLVFYALLTGGSLSVVRACVMLVLLLAAPLFGRESDGPTSLLTALFLILLRNPFAAASISLQLSFAAMAGILWLTPKLYKMLKGEKKHGKVFHFTSASFSATMGALVFTVPMSAYYFGTLVLLSPLSNLLCLWAASGIFLLGLAAVLAGFLWAPLGMLLAVAPRILAGYVLGAARLLAKLPYHAVYFSNPYLKYWLAFAYLLFLTAYLMKPKARRKYAVAALAACLTLAVTVRLGAARYGAGLDAVMLDVGQGQCVLLASGGKYALVDCGSGSSWYDAGELAAHHLKTMGCNQLDCLILSHYDKDHISGVTGLLARLDVREVLVTEGADDEAVRAAVLETASAHGAEVRTVAEETKLTLGKACLRVLPPVGDGDDNERSLAVLASLGEQDLLLTGDMDRAAEKALLAAWDLPDIEYLAAGHHGAKTSTSAELLDALKPETVCISVGSNSYGHPARETLRRLAERGCVVWRTDLHGDIHLSLN